MSFVAYVRNYLQYRRYSFESLWEFAGFWFVHYLAIALMSTLFYAFLSSVENWALGRVNGRTPTSMDAAIVHFCFALLLCSLAVFIVAHWPAGYGEGWWHD